MVRISFNVLKNFCNLKIITYWVLTIFDVLKVSGSVFRIQKAKKCYGSGFETLHSLMQIWTGENPDSKREVVILFLSLKCKPLMVYR